MLRSRLESCNNKVQCENFNADGKREAPYSESPYAEMTERARAPSLWTVIILSDTAPPHFHLHVSLSSSMTRGRKTIQSEK